MQWNRALTFASLLTLVPLSAAYSAAAADKAAPAAAPAAKPAAAPAAAPAAKPAAAPAAKPAAAPADKAAPADGKAAAPAADKGPPKPAAELEQLKGLAGNWKCDGKAPESPMGPAHNYKATMATKWELGNFWLAMAYEEKKSKETPLGFAAKCYLGFDAADKRFLFLGIDAMGGRIDLRSPGWEGDKLAFEGDSMGAMGKRKFRITFAKGKGPTEMMVTTSMADPKGQWAPPMEETCKKGG